MNIWSSEFQIHILKISLKTETLFSYPLFLDCTNTRLKMGQNMYRHTDAQYVGILTSIKISFISFSEYSSSSSDDDECGHRCWSKPDGVCLSFSQLRSLKFKIFLLFIFSLVHFVILGFFCLLFFFLRLLFPLLVPINYWAHRVQFITFLLFSNSKLQ